MRCPNCGNENPPDYMFCDECGARLIGSEQAATVPDSDTESSAAVPADSGQDKDIMGMGMAGSNATATADRAGAPSYSSLDAGSAATMTASSTGEDTDAGNAPDGAPAPLTEDTAAAATGVASYSYSPMDSGVSADDQSAAPASAMPGAEAAVPSSPAEAQTADTFEAVPVEASAPAGMGDMGAAAAPASAGSSGGAWASEALKHLDVAQHALASGDWGGFGQAMNTLRSALENAASATAGEAPSMAAAPAPAPAPAPEAPPPVTAGPAEAGTASSAWGGAPMTENGAAAPGVEDYQTFSGQAEAAPAAPAVPPYAMASEQAAEAAPAPVSEPAPAPAAAPVSTGMPEMAGEGIARLVVISTGAELSLPDQEEITVGREDPSSGIFPDVDLTPYGGEDGGVSRRHARLLHIGDDYFVEDLQSTNYTKLDGQRLPAHVRERLEDGARLDFGRVAVIFRRS